MQGFVQQNRRQPNRRQSACSSKLSPVISSEEDESVSVSNKSLKAQEFKEDSKETIKKSATSKQKPNVKPSKSQLASLDSFKHLSLKGGDISSDSDAGDSSRRKHQFQKSQTSVLEQVSITDEDLEIMPVERKQSAYSARHAFMPEKKGPVASSAKIIKKKTRKMDSVYNSDKSPASNSRKEASSDEESSDHK